jgi:hypothetical protein
MARRQDFKLAANARNSFADARRSAVACCSALSPATPPPTITQSKS